MFEQLHYATLLAGVQRKIFCQGCQNILDVRTSVEISVTQGKGYLTIMHVCAACFDKKGTDGLDTVTAMKQYMTNSKIMFDDVEVIDGRKADWETLSMMMA